MPTLHYAWAILFPNVVYSVSRLRMFVSIGTKKKFRFDFRQLPRINCKSVILSQFASSRGVRPVIRFHAQAELKRPFENYAA